MGLFNVSSKQYKNVLESLNLANRESNYQALEIFAEYLLLKLKIYAPSIEQHSRRVANIVKEIIEPRPRLSRDFIRTAYLTALLHDIGKLSLPLEIAVQNGQLSFDDAISELRTHPKRGIEVIKQESSRWQSLQTAIFEHKFLSIDGIIQHHERFDGTGYPEKRKGSDIHLLAKLIGVIDAFDRLTFRDNGENGSIIEAYINIEHAGIYDPAVVALLANYVLSKTELAERPDVGGLTAAVDVGLNKYVALAQTYLKQDAELIKNCHRIASAHAREKGRIIREMVDKIMPSLGLPFPCTKNILLRLCQLPLAEDITNKDVIYTSEHDSLVEAYRLERKRSEVSVGARNHLEITLKLKDLTPVLSKPIVAYAPRKSNENGVITAELWYCNVIDKDTVLLIN